MTGLIAACAFLALLAGTALVVWGLQPVPEAAPARTSRLLRAVRGERLSVTQRQRRNLVLGTGLVVGALAWLFTGWIALVLIVPAAVVAIPMLFNPIHGGTSVAVMDGIETWTRGLAGILATGSRGLEAVLIDSVTSAPPAIRPQISLLSTRLRAGWETEQALYALAEDLNDTTADLVIGNLVMLARTRGPGAAVMLEALAESVSDQVGSRHKVEADRARPRATARAVTVITLAVLGLGAISGHFEAYGTPVGQVLLVVLLTAYFAALAWMRHMSVGKTTPRFLTATEGRS